MNVGIEGQIEDPFDHLEPEPSVNQWQWGSSGSRGGVTKGRTDELRADDSPRSGGSASGLFSVSDKPKSTRGRKSAAAKASDDAAIRERIRGRLEEQLQLAVVFLFLQIGLWRGRKYKKINEQLAAQVEEAYHINDDSARAVAVPASHCAAKHLPIAVVETASDVLDPITVVTTAYGIYQTANAAEQRIVAGFIRSQRQESPRSTFSRGPLVPEHPAEQSDGTFGYVPSELEVPV